MVVVAVAGAHTREIWSRLPLEIAVAIEDRCRGWGPLTIERSIGRGIQALEVKHSLTHDIHGIQEVLRR